MIKFWLHISSKEQLERFRARESDPLKQWKISEEDWRNRRRRKSYVKAVEEMLERTDHDFARWHLVEADSKRYARVKVIETACAEIEGALRLAGLKLP